MARPRTASKILELKGAFKKHPDRKRTSEPVPNGEIDKTPPRHLTPGQKKCWREIVGIVPAGVLSDADKIHVEVVACLLAEYRAEKGLMTTARITRLTSEMGKLGLNPSARAGLSVERPKKNKYTDE